MTMLYDDGPKHPAKKARAELPQFMCSDASVRLVSCEWFRLAHRSFVLPLKVSLPRITRSCHHIKVIIGDRNVTSRHNRTHVMRLFRTRKRRRFHVSVRVEKLRRLSSVESQYLVSCFGSQNLPFAEIRLSYWLLLCI